MKEYDLVIIGGGCGGYPAAIYGSRYNLNTLVIAKELGGLITTTNLVENYPGFTSISGMDLAMKLEEHVKANNVPIMNDTVSSIVKRDDGQFVIKVDLDDEEILAKAVVLATGTQHRHLGVKGESEYLHKGVSYCATCDGPFYKGKVVSMVGGGDSACKEAMVLSQVCSKVYMFVRSELKGEPINNKRVHETENIEIMENVEIDEILGDDSKGVTSVRLKNGNNVDLDGVFIAIGQVPQSELAKSLGVELNDRNEIKIDKMSTTNVEGVFAAGDVTDLPWKQGITAAAEGSIAAFSAFEYLSHKFDLNNK